MGSVHPMLVGPLELVTAPVARPVSLDEARAHLRLDDDDADVERKIDAAVIAADRHIPGGRQLMTATFDLPLAGWWGRPLKLPRPPLQSVASLKYYDTAGALLTYSSTNYSVRIPWRQPGYLQWTPEVSLPSVQCDREHPVIVRFVAGYASAALVPANIKQAILIILGHFFRYRGDDDERGGRSSLEIPPAAQWLLDAESWGSYA